MGAKPPKAQVFTYHLSIHAGICIGGANVDLKALYSDDKLFWSGHLKGSDGPSDYILIEEYDLFGGLTKEGGLAGDMKYLPGKGDQLLDDDFARKIGEADGASSPAYRGLASIHFTSRAGKNGTSFMWGTQPYVKPVSATVTVKPAGLNPAMALIPQGLTRYKKFAVAVDWTGSMTGAATAVRQMVATVIDAAEEYMNAGGLVHMGFAGYGAFNSGNQLHGDLLGLPGGETIAEGFADYRVALLNGTFNVATIGAIDHDIKWATGTLKNYMGQTDESDGYGPVDDFIGIIIGNSQPTGFGGGKTAQQLTDEAVALWQGAFPGMRAHVIMLDNDWSTYASQLVSNGTLQLLEGEDPNALTTAVMRILFGDGLDANPANILYELATDPSFGAGSGEALIDVGSFSAAQAALYGEGFGLSLMWTQQVEIEAFAQEILDHIQATLFTHPRTGLLTLKLLRDDYDPDDLPIISPDNATLSNLNRKAPGDLINEISVTYTDPGTEEDATVSVQDNGLISTQGTVLTDSRNYYGVRYPELAMRLAARDLRASAFPLATCSADVDRSQWDLVPGSVVKLVWPEEGIDGIVMRVGDIDYGTTEERTIKLSLGEDVFALGAAEYSDPVTSDWVDPTTPPTAMDFSRGITAPFFLAVNSGARDFSGLPLSLDLEEVVSAVLAAEGASGFMGYQLATEQTYIDGTVFEDDSFKGGVGHGVLAGALISEVTSEFSISDVIGSVTPAAGVFVFIGNSDADEATMELCLITAVDPGDANLITVQRGMLDTVPGVWDAATEVWLFSQASDLYDTEIRTAGETLDYKLRTRTGGGTLAEPVTPILVVGPLDIRPHRPLRPADVKVEGVGFTEGLDKIDAIGNPTVAVTWSNRNRLMEDSIPLDWDDATMTVEDGQTTTVTVLDPADRSVVTTVDGLTGTSYNLASSAFGDLLIGIVRVTAKRDGLESFQGHEVRVHIAVLTADADTETADSTGYTADGDM